MEKVKLPKDVGKAIAIYRTGNSLDSLLVDCAEETISNPILAYWRSRYNCTAIFADAWRYGWETEPEKKFVLPMDGTKDKNIEKLFAYFGDKSWETDYYIPDDICSTIYVTQTQIDFAPDWVKAITPVEVTDDDD